MRKKSRWASMALAAGAMVAVGIVANPVPASAAVCGEYRTKYDVYYTHCGSYSVKVKTTYYPWYQTLPDVDCLAPGDHYIGPKAYVARVRSDGVRC